MLFRGVFVRVRSYREGQPVSEERERQRESDSGRERDREKVIVGEREKRE